MDKIDKYLCDLFNNDKSSGISELKEELRGHLLDMADEFISQGHSKEEAYDMAINKFDIDNDVLKILCENVKENNKKLEDNPREIILKRYSWELIVSEYENLLMGRKYE